MILSFKLGFSPQCVVFTTTSKINFYVFDINAVIKTPYTNQITVFILLRLILKILEARFRLIV